MENQPILSMKCIMTSLSMHVLGMTKHIRQLLVRGATFTLLSPKMLRIPLMMTFSIRKPMGIKTSLDFHQSPQVNL